ncbi:MAG: IclR family transcriptional regulator [Desulfobacterales bacterium]|nr:IclR family transcriptional regulator [Desulfobacterales bacterium]
MGKSTAMRDKNHINSVERALNILEIFGNSPHPLTLTEVANQADLTKTTTQRFIHTLVSLGYLNREENKRYFLGTRILSLGFQYLNSSNLIKLVKPYLDELSAEIDMTVNLGVLDNADVLILYRKEVLKFLRFDIHPGSKLLVYGSGMGRALLAALNDKEIKKILDTIDIRRHTPMTLISKEEIMEQIYVTRKTGVAISDREQSMDLCSIAVPLFNEQYKTIAAINVSMPIIKTSDPNVFKGAETKLIEKGDMISRRLGYVGPYPTYYVN